jgi:hypothetical protein
LDLSKSKEASLSNAVLCSQLETIIQEGLYTQHRTSKAIVL